MALTFLDDGKSNSGSGQKEFLNDWLKSNPKNKQIQHLVSEVRLVNSNKGYLIETDNFLAFIWKNAKVTSQLIEALEYWVSTPDTGYALYLVQDKPNSPNFKLATDKEEPFTWYSKKNGYSTIGEDLDSDTAGMDGNPFI